MTFYETAWPVRPEIHAAHRRLAEHWSRPGERWTGQERRAMVSAVRAARTGEQLLPWQSPTSIDGLVDSEFAALPKVVVDAVWRITQHPGTLTKDWYQQVVSSGVEELAYVELVAVVAMANARDYFCHALGLSSPELPAASSGEPSRPTLPEVAVTSHWVPTTPFDGPNIRKTLSATPSELAMQTVVLDAQYVPGGAMAVALTDNVWSLQRTQIELVASRVSALNECFY